MTLLRYTLVSEGRSDEALIAPIDWLFSHLQPDLPVSGVWSNPYQFPRRPQGLSEKIFYSLDYFPCELLFVHRDSDNETPEKRTTEIKEAFSKLTVSDPPHICIIPVRMLEAWFLFDEVAIRNVAENPNGSQRISLPKLSQIETQSDPKSMLRIFMQTASGKQGRRRANFATSKAIVLLSQTIDDYSPLLNVPSFNRLKTDIEEFLTSRRK